MIHFLKLTALFSFAFYLTQWVHAAEKQIIQTEKFTIQLIPAHHDKFPAYIDCNSPLHWVEGMLFLYTSVGSPMISFGKSLSDIGLAEPVHCSSELKDGRWIEGTWMNEDQIIYACYHSEQRSKIPDKTEHLTPRIGWLRSEGNKEGNPFFGYYFEDKGFILEAPTGSDRADSQNWCFTGGHGDCCMIMDQKKQYMYFFFSSYHKDIKQQGICIARMNWKDRDNPIGKVWKWYDGKWKEPGVGGKVSPILPAKKDWHQRETDVFWGPSIHWNTHLQLYMMLLTHCEDGGEGWKSRGIYVVYNPDISNPAGWSKPIRIWDGKEMLPSQWYPQFIGLDAKAKETDKLIGRKARFYLGGVSDWEVLFLKPGEKLQPLSGVEFGNGLL